MGPVRNYRSFYFFILKNLQNIDILLLLVHTKEKGDVFMKKEGFKELAEKISKDKDVKSFVVNKLQVVSLLSLLAAVSFIYITLDNISDYRGDMVDLLAIIFDIALVGVWISTAVENAAKRKVLLKTGNKKEEKKDEK